MKRSAERILTTHTGSLPRPEALLTLIMAGERGQPVEEGRFRELARSAVAEAVRKQVEIGIDVVNDGEMSKPSYATYIKGRLSGFGGKAAQPMPADMADFPSYMRRLFANMPAETMEMMGGACDGPVQLRDPQAITRELDDLKAALVDVEPVDVFVTAASPGVIARFLPNQHYPSHETYLEAIANAMRHEYQAIADAGFVL
jgi:5-methyltetrahydropteroyltriglutamate--homocysteine methyltransferase